MPSQIGKKLAKTVTCKILFDKQALDLYSVDASSYVVRPSAIAFPKNEKDIIKIVRFASRHKISVTPRGAGTGLVGGDLGTGIILDMRHFDKIKIGLGFVQTGSGLSKGELDDALRKRGRFFGPNPSIGPFCTVGGMIGTNASGSHSLKYGSTIDNLLQVRIVTSKGNIVTLPKKDNTTKKILGVIKPQIQKQFPHVSKNSCGYRIDKVTAYSNVQKIMAGSEGTLGIITSAKLKTLLLPKQNVLIIIAYKTLKDAVIDVPEILKLGPSAVEIIDHNIIQHIAHKIPNGTKCMLYVEFDSRISKKRIKVQQISSGKTILSTTKYSEISQWWTYRNSALSYSLKSISKQEIVSSMIEDATVPVHRLPLLLDLVKYLTSQYPMRVIIYGHAGNGNLHIRPILKKKNRRLIRKIALEFFSAVISIGGTITGEHGDGLARSEFVKLQYGSDTYSVFRKVKQFFDPTNTLNPGKKVIQ
ncbi:MAG: FAD-binding oxidoreductase [Thaumarchaeota archaeon]|nr:FAD-binding oxidoreductase [Nitrososphaerota archaeon]